ncbi:hypothetical protein ACFCV3_11155 [Kribbella sp. NPDC056345]|uniref:hypothetical protein n=1 Tax=Kribbella sp. NPDC056345 TaxID=3345789 RepID=UPI0035DC2896
MPIKRFFGLGIAILVTAGVAVGVQLRSRDTSSAAAPAPVSTEQKALLHQAEERLISKCMTAAGFRYDEQALPAVSIDRRFPFLIDDIAWARTNGYDRPAQKRPDPYLDSLSDERHAQYARTLLGQGKQLSVELPSGPRLSASDRGCIAEARRELYGDLPRWFVVRRTSDKLIFAVYADVRDDARFSTAMKQWSDCMRDRGYPVDNPGQLRGLAKDRGTGRDTAVAEATCATTTPAGRALRELEAEHLAKITAEHRRELQDLDALERSALPRAVAVLGKR